MNESTYNTGVVSGDGNLTPPGELPTKDPSVPMGILAGAGLGLVAAVLYALLAVGLDREIGFMALLIGLGVAWGMLLVGKRQSPFLGVVAALLAAASFVLAVLFMFTALIQGDPSLPLTWGESAEEVVTYAGDYITYYFTEDFWGWVFLLFAVVPAFVTASGIRQRVSED